VRFVGEKEKAVIQTRSGGQSDAARREETQGRRRRKTWRGIDCNAPASQEDSVCSTIDAQAKVCVAEDLL